MTGANRATVLVVDDDDDVRFALSQVLEDLGCRCLQAANGAEALEVIHETSPAPDGVLLDWMMPVMNGLQFLEARAADPKAAAIPVVLMTAAGTLASQRAHVQAHLKKPLSYDELVRLVNTWSDDRR